MDLPGGRHKIQRNALVHDQKRTDTPIGLPSHKRGRQSGGRFAPDDEWIHSRSLASVKYRVSRAAVQNVMPSPRSADTREMRKTAGFTDVHAAKQKRRDFCLYICGKYCGAQSEWCPGP